MPPADQRLGPCEAQVVQVHLRLVGEVQFLVLDRRPERPFDLPRARLPRRRFWVEHTSAVTVQSRLVEGEFGMFEERRGVATVVGKGDADAAADPHRDAVQHERRGDRVIDGFGQRPGLGLVDVGAEEGERVCAEARHARDPGVERPEALDDRAKQAVAYIAAERGIDRLEPIEVQREGRGLAAPR